LEAVGRKFSHRPGNPAIVGVVRWPSAGDTAGYRLRRPKLTPVYSISTVVMGNAERPLIVQWPTLEKPPKKRWYPSRL